MLTSAQKLHYQVFGFLVFPGLFNQDEIGEISRLFAEVMTEARAGKPFTGEKRQMLLTQLRHQADHGGP